MTCTVTLMKHALSSRWSRAARMVPVAMLVSLSTSVEAQELGNPATVARGLAVQLRDDAAKLLTPQSPCLSLVSAYELLGATLYYAKVGGLDQAFTNAISGQRANVAILFNNGGCGTVTSSGNVGGTGRLRLFPVGGGGGRGGGGGVTGRAIPELLIAYSMLSVDDRKKLENVLSPETLAELNAIKGNEPLPDPVLLDMTLSLLQSEPFKNEWMVWSRDPNRIELRGLKFELDKLWKLDPAQLQKLEKLKIPPDA